MKRILPILFSHLVLSIVIGSILGIESDDWCQISDGRKILVVQNAKDWQSAQSFCVKNDAKLITMSQSDDFDFNVVNCFEEIEMGSVFWTGLVKVDGNVWNWDLTNQTEIIDMYTRESERCGVVQLTGLSSSQYKIDAQAKHCEERFYFICEIDENNEISKNKIKKLSAYYDRIKTVVDHPNEDGERPQDSPVIREGARPQDSPVIKEDSVIQDHNLRIVSEVTGQFSDFHSKFRNHETRTKGWIRRSNGKEVLLVEKRLEWLEAQKYCNDRGGRLLTFCFTDEFESLSYEVFGKDKAMGTKYWTGLHKSQSGQWEWDLTFCPEPTDISPGSPNDKCGGIKISGKIGGKYIITPRTDGCSTRLPFLCERLSDLCDKQDLLPQHGFNEKLDETRYLVVDAKRNFDFAALYCIINGAQLLSIKNEVENKFITDLINKNEKIENVWLSGKARTVREFCWETGELFKYQNFESYVGRVISMGRDGKWRRDYEDKKNSIICQKRCGNDIVRELSKNRKCYKDDYENYQFYQRYDD